MNNKKLNKFAKEFARLNRECMEEVFENKSNHGGISGQEYKIGKAYFNKSKRRKE